MITPLSAADLRARLDSGESLQLVDVRSHNEYRAGHIPHAINVPMERCEARLEDLHADRPLVLICQSGFRAGKTLALLAADRPEALVLEGGTKGWIAAGLPVVRDTATRWSLERQTRLGAGLMVLLGTLGSFAWPPAIGLAIFAGAGLTFAGSTDICLMGLMLAKAPWNQPRPAPSSSSSQPLSAS